MVEGLNPTKHAITKADTGPLPPTVLSDVVVLQPRIGHLATDAASLLASGLRGLKQKVGDGEQLTEPEWNRLMKMADAIVKMSKEEREMDREVREEMAKMEEKALQEDAIEALRPELLRRGWKPPEGGWKTQSTS